jgi:hypothetical protein
VSPVPAPWPVVELRQYTLHPGRRDVLIELFDRELVESQEAVGMKVLGQFRDLDDPNRFVWLRCFRDLASRAPALQAFYGGPVWRTHCDAANATMVDSSNVLLLRPARPTSGFALDGDRPPPGADVHGGVVVLTVCPLAASAADDLSDAFERDVAPALTQAGASIVASFVTEPAVNEFPSLPVREGENVFVWLSAFPDRSADERQVAPLPAALADRLAAPPEVRRLSPTARSLLRG